jgi:hypothetical protein
MSVVFAPKANRMLGFVTHGFGHENYIWVEEEKHG